MNEEDYYLWLQMINELQINDKFEAVEAFGSVYELWHSLDKEIASTLLSNRVLNILRKSKKLFNIEETRLILHKHQTKFIARIDKAFPEKLLAIKNPPLGLFYRGEMPKENVPSIGIVGSRQHTLYGQRVCEEFCEELCNNRIQIISGLAMGIDSVAHKGALKFNGKTFGILGTGVEAVYPKENRLIYNEMYVKGGVISEYPFGSISLKTHFPERNRLIAGLSDAIIVIEARKKSGTMITVDRALEQGKDIFVVPGRIGDPLSEGCLELIKQGANVITTTDDIALCLKDKYPDFISYKKDENCQYSFAFDENNKKFTLEKDEIIVYSCLSLDPKHLDIIVLETGIDYFSVFSILSSLVEKNIVIEVSPEYFAKK